MQKADQVAVSLSIAVDELRKWDLQTGGWKLYPGTYVLFIGRNAEEAVLRQKFWVE